MSYSIKTRRNAGRIIAPIVLVLLATLSACEEAPRELAEQNLAGLGHPNPNTGYFLGGDPFFPRTDGGNGP